MTDSELAEDTTRKDASRVLSRFLHLHRQRLGRIQEELRQTQRDFLELLPLLLHTNHPLLPGYVSSATPAGISGFQPGADLVRLAKAHCHGYGYTKRALPRYSIHGLYLMGSTGSLAYSRRSDFDFWLCHAPDLADDELAQLKAKLKRLEQNAADHGLEVHFFPMNLERFRRGEVQALSKESSGSTQFLLLLEEFYRSGVYLAGRYPLWWLVPPGEEAGYEAHCRNLIERRVIDPDEFLDFGALHRIPAEEFFGAAHWQLYKGIASPYKSVLKILLMEAYAAEYPEIRWLCNDIKAAVYDEQFHTEDLDSYLLLYRRLEAYLQGRGERERLELIRRCLYVKVDRPLTRRGVNPRWQEERLRALVGTWQWDRDRLLTLDNRRNWKAREVMRERLNLVHELNRSYRLLMDFARQHGGVGQINPKELKLLGRKLYATMEHRPGKIDGINPDISSDLTEPLLSLLQQDGRWQLFLGDRLPGQTVGDEPLKQSPNLLEVLAWAQLNGLIGPQSRLLSHVPQHPDQRELQALRGTLAKLFPDRSAFRAGMRALAHEPRLKACALFINPDSALPSAVSAGGRHRVSDRFDPLSYSAKQLCLINGIEQLITTTWGEVLTFRYKGLQGLPEAMVRYLRLSVGFEQDKAPPMVESFCFNETLGSAVGRRVADLFAYIAHIYGPEGPGPHSRYLLPVGPYHFLLHRPEGGYAWRLLKSYPEVLDCLAEPMAQFSPVVPDPAAFQDSPLPVICARRAREQLQVFFHIQGQTVDLYVVDEYGSIFQQSFSNAEPRYLLARQHRFFTSLRQRRGLGADAPWSLLLADSALYYQLQKDAQGKWGCQPVPPPAVELDDELLQLRLIGPGQEGEAPQILLSCGDQEFGSAEYDDQVYAAIVRHVLGVRRGQRDYPIYLTGVEPQTLYDAEDWHTMRLLRQRRDIEQRLNQELAAQLAGR